MQHVLYFELHYLGVSEKFWSIQQLQQKLHQTTCRANVELPEVKIFVYFNNTSTLVGAFFVPITEIDKLSQTVESKFSAIYAPQLNNAIQDKTGKMDAELRKRLDITKVELVVSKSGAKLRLVRSALSDFCGDKLVSLGQRIFKDNVREGIVLDPKSPLISQHYDRLARCLRGYDKNHFTKVLINFLHTLFLNHNNEAIKLIVD
jgi:hypothetical protein